MAALAAFTALIVLTLQASAGAGTLVLRGAGSNKHHRRSTWTLPTGVRSKVYAPDCTGRPHFQPRSIIAACADANLWLSGIHWSSWTTKAATGVAVYHWNDCVPACYSGHF